MRLPRDISGEQLAKGLKVFGSKLPARLGVICD